MQVEAERAYHQRVLQILDQLEGEVSHCIPLSFFHYILHIEKYAICYIVFFWYQQMIIWHMHILIIDNIRTTTK